jgi:hypothetical protein
MLGVLSGVAVLGPVGPARAQPSAGPAPSAGVPPSAAPSDPPPGPAVDAPSAAPKPSAAPAPSTAPNAAPAPVLPLAESLTGSARDDYAAARLLYQDGDFAGAFTKLESAHLGSKDPRLLWNMAACEKALRHYANVIVLLERYLAEGKLVITDEERRATRDLVQTVQQFVNELTLRVSPDGADVFIDDNKVGTTPLAGPLWLDMGRRRLTVQKTDFVRHDAELDLAGGKSLTLDVVLQAEVHQGTLSVVSDPDALIRVDGKVVGTAAWVGNLPSGAHNIEVSAPGKRTNTTAVQVKDHETATLHLNLLEPDSTKGGSNALWWVLGGVALAGASVGGYLLLKPGDGPAQESGTWGLTELGAL